MELVGGFNPIEKYDRQNGSLPQFSGWTFKKYLSCHHLGNSYRLWESSFKKKITHTHPHLWCWHSITHLRQGEQGKLKWFHLKWCSVFLAAHRSRVWQAYRVTTFIPSWELVGQPYNPVYVQLSSLVFSEIWKSFGNYQNQRKKHWDLTYVWCFFVWHAVPNPDSAQQFNVFFLVPGTFARRKATTTLQVQGSATLA